MSVTEINNERHFETQDHLNVFATITNTLDKVVEVWIQRQTNPNPPYLHKTLHTVTLQPGETIRGIPLSIPFQASELFFATRVQGASTGSSIPLTNLPPGNLLNLQVYPVFWQPRRAEPCVLAEVKRV